MPLTSSAQGCNSPSPSKLPSASGLEHIKLYLLDLAVSWLKPTGVGSRLSASARARAAHRSWLQTQSLMASGLSWC